MYCKIRRHHAHRERWCARNIQRQNPAIAAVEVDMDRETDDLISLATAGQNIGASNHILYLAVCIGVGEIIDPPVAQAFFKGLALNRSIMALKIEIDEEVDDDDDCVEKALKALLPFFRCNNKLQVFEVIYEGRSKSYPEGCINDVLTTAKWLNSLHLYSGNWELTAKTALDNGHVHHLSFYYCRFSRGACVNIRNLLSDQQCILSSFILDCRPLLYIQFQRLSMYELINGISNNQSLKRLKLIGLNEELATCFFDSMRHLRHSALETIHISGEGGTKFRSLHAFVQQMPNVKSLTISHCRLDRVVQATNNSVEPYVTSALRELQMERFRRDEDLNQLSSYILNSTSLRVLELDSGNISSASWVSFFNTIRNAKYLESLKIRDIPDEAIESFSNWIRSTRTLKALKMSCFVSSVGRQSFAAALASLENLEDIHLDFMYTPPDAATGMLLLNAFIAKPTLKKVSLVISTGAQLQMILNTIGSPTCGITEMEISSYYQSEDTERLILERAEHEQTLINSLRSNASLRILELDFGHGRSDFDWFSIAGIICNTSSIDATIRSNHTLESLSLTQASEMPIDIYSMLYLNKNSNKHSVIREKILRNHNLHHVNFVPTSLPEVFSWLGHPDADQKLGLSQLFGILRAAPHLIKKVEN
jgi:hypothetical protein